MATRHKPAEPPLSSPGEGTSGTASTYDPLGTVPYLGEGKAPASFAVEMATAAGSRYRILGTLGEGGMGVVYRAEDTLLGRTVAVKTIPAARNANPWAKERFLNEARAASALDHPNLCAIYEIGETNMGQLFLTMPCYDGETLRSRLQRGPLPLPEAIHIAQQAARGLAKVHGLGIVHCDIKPANLMLTGDGVVKILDFGIARLSGPAPHDRAGPYGTPGYRSHEQARGDEVDASSDVWSIGAVLHEMVTGCPPSRDEHGEALPWEEWDPILRQLAEAPPELDHTLSRMLARAPAERYKDAAALLVDLDYLADRISGVAGIRGGRSLRRCVREVVAWIAVACLTGLGGYFHLRTSGPFWPQPPSGSAIHPTGPPITLQITEETNGGQITFYSESNSAFFLFMDGPARHLVRVQASVGTPGEISGAAPSPTALEMSQAVRRFESTRERWRRSRANGEHLHPERAPAISDKPQ
jgi:serine/threonine protein kinase